MLSFRKIVTFFHFLRLYNKLKPNIHEKITIQQKTDIRQKNIAKLTADSIIAIKGGARNDTNECITAGVGCETATC